MFGEKTIMNSLLLDLHYVTFVLLASFPEILTCHDKQIRTEGSSQNQQESEGSITCEILNTGPEYQILNMGPGYSLQLAVPF